MELGESRPEIVWASASQPVGTSVEMRYCWCPWEYLLSGYSCLDSQQRSAWHGHLAIRVLCPNLQGKMLLISELPSQRNSLLVYFDPRQCGSDRHHQLRYWQMRWKHQLRLLASTIHWTAMPSKGEQACVAVNPSKQSSLRAAREGTEKCTKMVLCGYLHRLTPLET